MMSHAWETLHLQLIFKTIFSQYWIIVVLLIIFTDFITDKLLSWYSIQNQEAPEDQMLYWPYGATKNMNGFLQNGYGTWGYVF